MNANICGRAWLRLAVVGAAWTFLGGATAPNPEAIRQWLQRVERVQTITRRILAANLVDCPESRPDFGLVLASRDPSASPEMQSAWAQAVGLGEGTMVLTVLPGGPAADAGLRKGDAVLAVAGVAREPGAEGLARFNAAYRSASESGHLALTIRRGGEVREVAFAGQTICRADVRIDPRKGFNARTHGETITIDNALPDLLPDDDELAFVVAHEAAHVFLGHARDADTDHLKGNDQRAEMEVAADRLGVRLMARAGYAPEAAARANPKITDANRGPISRLLDIHGPYMAKDKRTQFLAGQATAIRAEKLIP